MSSTAEIKVVVMFDEPPSDECKQLLIEFEGKLIFIQVCYNDDDNDIVMMIIMVIM